MDDDKLINRLLTQNEGSTLDFKSESIRLDNDHFKAEFIKDTLCMANTPRDGSAHIIYGVRAKPDGKKDIISVNQHPDDANLQTLISGKVNPVPQLRYRSISYEGKNLGILEIYPRRGGPFMIRRDYDFLRKGVVYFRRGSSNDEARPEDLPEIINWMTSKDHIPEKEATDIRKGYIEFGGGPIAIPCFLPSISSFKTQLKPIEYLRILNSSSYPFFLISAYDLYNCDDSNERKQMDVTLSESIKTNKIIFLDSGYYESSWKNDENWTEVQYREILKAHDFHFAFSFDKPVSELSKKSEQRIINEIERRWLEDREITSKGAIIPIIHAPKEILPQVSCGIAQRLNPIMIAIPERELGQGIIASSRTLIETRSALNQIGAYCPIHLLGTGNPISMLIYVACGVDSFDGLEWCQMIVNYDTARVHHLQHYDFFQAQSKYGIDPQYPRSIAPLLHNLDFYSEWMSGIQEALKNGKITELVQQYFAEHVSGILKPKLPEIFNNESEC